MQIKNRVIRAATNEHLAHRDGQLSQAWSDNMIQLAQNEVGLVITGHMSVDRRERSDEGQAVLDEQTDLELLRRTAQGVHEAGGRIVAQLNHCGKKASERVNGHPPRLPAQFTLAELDRVVEQFRTAALLCRQAGFDGVQIHNAYGHLLANFLNHVDNRRTDEYAGSLENRFRLTARVIRAVRESCGPQFAILVKVGANGYGDLRSLLKLYQAVGVDGVEVCAVDFDAKRWEKRAFCLEELLRAREGIDLPVSLVGGIFSQRTAERVLLSGIPFVSFSRALLCQPDFIARMKRGEQEESRCQVCDECFQSFRRRYVRCILHRTPVPQLQEVFGPQE